MTKQRIEELRRAVAVWRDAPHGDDCEDFGRGMFCLEGCPKLLARRRLSLAPDELLALLGAAEKVAAVQRFIHPKTPKYVGVTLTTEQASGMAMLEADIRAIVGGKPQ